MTETNYDPYRVFESALAGVEFLSRKDQSGIEGARKCLELILNKADMGRDGKALFEGFTEDPRDIQKAITSAMRGYDSRVEALKASELPALYSEAFDHYFEGDSKTKAQEVFTQLGDETYKTIVDRVSKASAIMQARGFSEDEKKEAEKTIKKYQKVITIISAFREHTTQKYVPKIADEIQTKALREMVTA